MESKNKLKMDVTERHFLVVDDDFIVLRIVEDALCDEGYVIHKASNGHEGLELLRENPVCVVLSDYQMPLMTGIEFLSQAKAQYPNTIRLITSSMPDHDIFNQALRDEVIYKFLPKPKVFEQLSACICEAFQRYEQSEKVAT